MVDQTTIVDLVGYYDNFGEPIPSWNRTSTIVPTTIVFLVSSHLCVYFRLYTRFKIIYAPGWDDLFVVLVLLSGTLGSICICIATRYGMGQHFLLISESDSSRYLNLFYVANATYSMSTALVKLALLFQYLRIFKEEPRMRKLCIGLAIFTSLWGLAYSFMSWFPCFPVQAYWIWAQSATCYGYGSFDANVFFGTYFSSSLINMVLDIIILIIPVPLYFRKDTQNRTKMGLCALLVMGGLVNFLSIWRVVTFIEHRAATYPTFDPTWYGPISILLATIEVDLATICASTPVFWPILKARMDRIFVTQEIKIERQHRFSTIEDQYVLQCRTNEIELDTSDTMHSRATSQSSLTRQDSRAAHNTKDGSHYADRYIIAQVDPLNIGGTVQSEITAQRTPLGRKHSKAGSASVKGNGC